MSEFNIERLDSRHDRANFECGESLLNDYLKRYARQNMKNDSARVYVAVQPDNTERICAYFTLSAGNVDALQFPDRVRKGWPRDVPTVLVGRLAVDRDFQGRGLGGDLIYAIFTVAVCAAETIGIAAIDVHALNEGARLFYSKFGFAALQDDPFHLYLALATARESLL